MKKIIALILALVMCMSLVACGSDKPADKTEDKPADDGKVYELSLSLHDPVTSNNGKFYQNWADEIAKATNGRVKITLYGSGTLAAGPDVADMVEGGGADMGWIFTGFYANQYPLTEVVTLVLEGFENCEATTNAMWDLYESTPAMQAEWEEFQLLTLYSNPANLIMSKDKPIESMADMTARSIRSPAGPIATAVSTWGASPIMMAPGDIYQALEKNNISAVIWETAGVCNFTLQEQLKYYTRMPLFQGVFALVMNKDKFNSLPTDLQDAIMEVSGRAGSIAAAIDFDNAAVAAEKTITEAGGTFVEISDAAKAEFAAAIVGQSEEWAKGKTTADFDGMAFLEKARELVAKYNKEIVG